MIPISVLTLKIKWRKHIKSKNATNYKKSQNKYLPIPFTLNASIVQIIISKNLKQNHNSIQNVKIQLYSVPTKLRLKREEKNQQKTENSIANTRTKSESSCVKMTKNKGRIMEEIP